MTFAGDRQPRLRQQRRAAARARRRRQPQPPLRLPAAVRRARPETKTGNLTLTYASQIHACVVEIDEETGKVEILDYAAMDECGTPINPQIVEGQVHGAAAHGIAAALQETLDYDEDGQLLNGTFWDYHVVSAPDTPMFKTGNLRVPRRSRRTARRGWARAAARRCTQSAALQDALGPDDAIVDDTFNSSERVWKLLRSGESGQPRGVTVRTKEVST